MYYSPIMTNKTSLVFALLKSASKVERRLDRALSCTKGISFTEYYLLTELNDNYNGSATRVEIAAAVGLTPSAITRALKPLEKIGFVVTEKSDRDARRSMATLTNAGTELLKDAHQIVLDEIEQLDLPDTGVDETLALLDKAIGIR